MFMVKDRIGIATARQMKVKTLSGAAWYCDNCHVWWGSQMSRKLKSSFLTLLVDEMGENLPWESYRGWYTKGDASVCPECREPIGRQFYVIGDWPKVWADT